VVAVVVVLVVAVVVAVVVGVRPGRRCDWRYGRRRLPAGGGSE